MEQLILGVEIGGTKLQLAAGKLDGSILMSLEDRVSRKEGGAGIRRWLLAKMPGFIAQAEAQFGGRIEAIGYYRRARCRPVPAFRTENRDIFNATVSAAETEPEPLDGDLHEAGSEPPRPQEPSLEESSRRAILCRPLFGSDTAMPRTIHECLPC